LPQVSSKLTIIEKTARFFNEVSIVNSKFKYPAENYPTAQYEQDSK
jgi:hypothetical protein